MNIREPGFLREFAHYMKKYRSWWLVPFVFMLLVFLLLAILGQTMPLAPSFIYKMQ